MHVPLVLDLVGFDSPLGSSLCAVKDKGAAKSAPIGRLKQSGISGSTGRHHADGDIADAQTYAGLV